MNWSQLRTILWLRWRLTINQWSRGGQLNFVITMIGAVTGLVTAAGCGIAGLLAGAFALSRASPMVILGVCDVIIGIFLFIWIIGIVASIQQSETIDINRMLHLPISQKELFLVNYIASHLTPSVILFLPGMLGLSLGLALGKSVLMILLFPLILAFLFMITAWTYCLRGWLVTLMINKRRRQMIIAIVTFTFILLGQLPNLLTNIMFHPKKHRQNNIAQSAPSEQQTTQESVIPPVILAAHHYVPFLWVGNGAMSLAQGTALPAILGTAGAAFLGGWGLRRAYLTTFRFYQGKTTGKKIPQKQKTQKSVATPGSFLAKQIPGIPQEAAALALAFFRSLTRAPEVKMAMATNIFIIIILGAMFFVRHSVTISDKFKPFIATGAITFMFFGLSQLMLNQFGFDRCGFRQLVLLPVQRKYILLGKNLANLPIILGIGLILLILLKVAMHISLIVIIAAGFQMIAAFLLLSMAGNLMSIFVPYHVAYGSMKLSKVPALTVFLIFISHTLFPAAMIPMFVPPVLGLLLSIAGWLPAGVVNIFCSIIMLVIFALLYWFSLSGLGSLLQRREQKILEVVTREVE